MGNEESESEHLRYKDKFENIIPSKVEFDYWTIIHYNFNNASNYKKQFKEYAPEKQNISKIEHVSYSYPQKNDLILKLDQNAQLLLKIHIFVRNAIKSSLDILEKCRHSKFLIENIKKYSGGDKKDNQKDNFDFENYQACIFEILKLLDFIYEFDSYILIQPEIINDFFYFKRIINEFPQMTSSQLKTTIENIKDLCDIISKDKPLSTIFSNNIKLLTNEGEPINVDPLINLLYIVCYTSLYNKSLSASEILFLLNSLVALLYILDLLLENSLFDKIYESIIPLKLVFESFRKHSDNNDLSKHIKNVIHELPIRIKKPIEPSTIAKKILKFN